MGQSYRIRTELGVNKTINVQLDQDFEYLEILSLKIQQSEVYTRSCANYGVVVGRITANNGFGVPNARVSIFIPIEEVDESNPIITSIYPYTSPTDKNSDGYRYNLLPYEKSYSKHAATGTLPSRADALTDDIAVEIYDKYYKYTSKTNDSGDYMIMGAPLGSQTVVMDVDLSDIGEFSLTPQDLIRMGLASEGQVAGNRFRTSTDLTSLPQIISLTKDVEVSPLWGDPAICQIAVSRLDFDLRDDANVDIQPTSVFMGSMFSSPDKFRVRKNCKPRDDMGNLCDLTTGPGQILALRQTINQDSNGNPVLEQYELEQAGNIIDGSGSWLTELPMNLDYFTTNEFGEKVLSNDPSIGIPTKAKYRFKVKWTQPNDITLQTRRAYHLIPNVKEYGWTTDTMDPTNYAEGSSLKKQQASSYYFGLDWTGYTNGFIGINRTERLNEVIDAKDTFYEFQFNRVYTVSSLIDQYKKGAKGRFIGIKEIDDDSCSSTNNKFPVNDGFRNFDFLFFLFSLLMTILQPVGIIILIIGHVALWARNLLIKALCDICEFKFLGKRWFSFICRNLGINCNKRDDTFRLPMITYPDCQTCDCKQSSTTSRVEIGENYPENTSGSGILTAFSSPDSFYNNLTSNYFSADTENGDLLSVITSVAIAGSASTPYIGDPTVYKMPKSQILNDKFAVSSDLPIGERINIFNQRKNYFLGQNKIKVTIAKDVNIGKFHYDNTLTVVSQEQYNSGELLTFVNIVNTTDKNYLYSASTPSGIVTGISGTSYNTLGPTTVNITYANPNNLLQNTDLSVNYNLPYGSDEDNYRFPSDVEYFQVVTAITVSQYVNMLKDQTGTVVQNSSESFYNVLYGKTNVSVYSSTGSDNYEFQGVDYLEGIGSQYILILQRGVDPYSPLYNNEYRLGTLFGVAEDDEKFTFTAATRLNIPIQKIMSPSKMQDYNQGSMYYQSYFFKPGIDGDVTPGYEFTGYTTTNTAYYGLLDSTQSIPSLSNISDGGVITNTVNGFYSSSPNTSKYDLGEDVSGLGFMELTGGDNGAFTVYNDFSYSYYSKSLFSLSNPLLDIGTPQLNVLRTDRLPTSDGLDGGSFSTNPSILQQNLNFTIYLIDTSNEDISSVGFATGANIVVADLEGLPNSVKVLESFDCENMVGLNCYTGIGTDFEIKSNCPQSDSVENGCYLFMRKPLTDLFKDIGTFGEWGYRFRFFYGLCRGVLSQSFMNSWINGTLYAFPIQVDTYYNKQNKAQSPIFCKQIVYFDSDTNNFYYRSSPYSDARNRFIGMFTGNEASVNDINLLFPTTIMNLGMKDYFYSEITFEPATNAYIIPNLNPTSYADTSDLINLFVISRITDATFLGQVLNAGDNSLQQLFSRYDDDGIFDNRRRRLDGDIAQLLSINSEVGNVNFSPEYYTAEGVNPSVDIGGTEENPIVEVWFSSTTQDLQTKDYLTPGRINFRGSNNVGYYPYPYGIKSQVVPFYPWKLKNTVSIFGNQYNNWGTRPNDIIQNTEYQGLDRSTLDTKYFIGSNMGISDLNARGYIFNVDSNGNYTTDGAKKQSFLTGAPYHFYFGVVNGETALDKFKTKYSVDE